MGIGLAGGTGRAAETKVRWASATSCMRNLGIKNGDILRTLVKLALVTWLGIGAVVAAGVGFVAYGFFIYFGSPWVEFFLSAAGVTYDRRHRIVAAILTPEAWLYYAPAASAGLFFLATAAFCCSRSLLLRRNRTKQAPPMAA